MKVTVYCGANRGSSPVYQEAAHSLGSWIGQNHHTLVYGGGKVGLMGLLADTVLANGGAAVGVMPRFLQDREIAHTGLTELVITEDMSSRKQMMIDLGEAFIALPGGPGTLEEISEAVSWARIGQNDSPCILFNTAAYYFPLKNMYDHMVSEGFLSRADRSKILFSDDLSEIETFIRTYQPPEVRTYKK